MKLYATRIPNPVLVTARENRKAVKISHTVGSLYPAKICSGATVLVNDRIVIPTSVLTPIGTGLATRATTVAVKTASRWRWLGFSAGNDTKYNSTPGTNTITQRSNRLLWVVAAPCPAGAAVTEDISPQSYLKPLGVALQWVGV